MRGLILKDIYCVRLQIFLSMAIMLLPNIMFTFFMADKAGVQEEYKILMIFICGLLNYVNICLFSSFMLNTFDADVNHGWGRIVRTFPVSGNKVVAAKFAATGIILAILTGITLVFNIIDSCINSLPLEPLITIPVCIALLQAAVLFPMYPVAMTHGTKCASVLYIMAEMIAVSLAAVVIFNVMNNLENWEIVLRCVFYAGSVVFAVVSATLSVFFGRREVNAA